MKNFLILSAIVGFFVITGVTFEWVLPVPYLPALLPNKPVEQDKD